MKTCFITGGNSGIGKAGALQLAEKEFRVVVGCRDRKRSEAALADIRGASPKGVGELVIVDMASQDSISRAAGEFRSLYSSLDVPIHNAADFDPTRKEPVKSPDGIETVWVTNHLGPVLLTRLLMPALEQSDQARIITVASQGLMLHPGLRVNLGDPKFERRPFSVAQAYYQSKLAQAMYTYHLPRELRETGITVHCVRVTNVKIGRRLHLAGRPSGAQRKHRRVLRREESTGFVVEIQSK